MSDDSPPELADLCNELAEVSIGQLKKLVIQLGVRSGKCDDVDYYPVPERKQKLLDAWLREDIHATWSKLVSALNNPAIGEHTLAENIRAKHCPSLQPCHSEQLSETLPSYRGTAVSQATTTTTSHIATVPLRTGKLDIDRDVLKAKRLLKSLNKDELKDLFRELGLSDTTVRDKYSEGVSVYADDLVRSWILERDAVLESEVYLGGATWENLKKALIELKHIGIAGTI